MNKNVTNHHISPAMTVRDDEADRRLRFEELKQMYTGLRGANNNKTANELTFSILMKINGLFSSPHSQHHQYHQQHGYRFNAPEANLLIEILMYIGEQFDVKDPSQLKNFIYFTNTVTNLSEKSMIELNGNDMNWFCSFYLSKIAFYTTGTRTNTDILHDLYRFLGALIYKNAAYLSKSNLDKLISDRNGILLTLLDSNNTNLQSKNENLFLINVQCLYNLTLQSNDGLSVDDSIKLKCLKLLIRLLRLPHIVNFNETVYSKILVKCLQAIENLLILVNILPTDMLTDILSIVKTLQYYGLHLDNIKQTTKQISQLKPSDIHVPILNQVHQNDFSDLDNEPQASTGASTKKKRYTKKASQRTSVSTASGNKLEANDQQQKVPPLIEYNKTNEKFTFRLQNSHLSTTTTSESDSSDIEVNNVKNKFFIEKCNAKVREAALNVLQIAFQTLDKRTILNYWNSFIPDASPTSRTFTLLTSIQQDHSPKIRLLAIKTLNIFIDNCTKNLFQLATDTATSSDATATASTPTTLTSNTTQHASNPSFISKSQIFSSVLKNLYRKIEGLIKNENFLINLNELFQTLNLLIKYTQFKKLSFGFLTGIFVFLNDYLTHSDLNIRIQCVNAYCTLIQAAQTNFEVYLLLNLNEFSSLKVCERLLNANKGVIQRLNGEFQRLFQVTISPVTYFYTNDFNSEFIKLDNGKKTQGTRADATTSVVDFKLTESDEVECLIDRLDLNDGSGFRTITKSWLIRYCVQTILNCSDSQKSQLRIACLQLLCALCKQYFYLIREQFDDIERILVKNLSLNYDQSTNGIDQNVHDEIHSTLKLFEELSRCLATRSLHTVHVDLNRCVMLWSNLIQNSNLVNKYLMDERNYLLSSQACDCLASIGDDIFTNLLINKRFLVITCLINLTKSTHSNLIRSASIRALGVYVTFQLLKEDTNFINDISYTIVNLLQNDSNNLVKQKASWSFANLTEILLENKFNQTKSNTHEESYLTVNVYLRLLKCSYEVCNKESDKIKSYLVRTLGNLLNYLDDNLMKQLSSDDVITNAIKQLVACKSTKMLKVKWNLCYSIGICLRNSEVLCKPEWQDDLYSVLIDLFKNETNYKVRINACCAFLQFNIKSPRQYGFQQFYMKLWLHLIENFLKVFNSNETFELQHKHTLIKEMCKFLTYLCKYLLIEDLDEIEVSLNGLFIQQDSVSQRFTDTIEYKQIKYNFNEYIFEIHNNTDSYKNEIQSYNDALNQLNIISSTISEPSQSRSGLMFFEFISSILRKEQKLESHNESQFVNEEPIRNYPFKSVYD